MCEGKNPLEKAYVLPGNIHSDRLIGIRRYRHSRPSEENEGRERILAGNI